MRLPRLRVAARPFVRPTVKGRYGGSQPRDNILPFGKCVCLQFFTRSQRNTGRNRHPRDKRCHRLEGVQATDLDAVLMAACEAAHGGEDGWEPPYTAGGTRSLFRNSASGLSQVATCWVAQVSINSATARLSYSLQPNES